VSAMRRQMALTADLVARAARVVEDLGPSPGAVYRTDDDHEVTIRSVLAQAPAGDVWLFGFGSLMWKPACEVAESRLGTLRSCAPRWQSRAPAPRPSAASGRSHAQLDRHPRAACG
jgi:cation transport regulator ChaC